MATTAATEAATPDREPTPADPAPAAAPTPGTPPNRASVPGLIEFPFRAGSDLLSGLLLESSRGALLLTSDRILLDGPRPRVDVLGELRLIHRDAARNHLALFETSATQALPAWRIVPLTDDLELASWGPGMREPVAVRHRPDLAVHYGYEPPPMTGSLVIVRNGDGRREAVSWFAMQPMVAVDLSRWTPWLEQPAVPLAAAEAAAEETRLEEMAREPRRQEQELTRLLRGDPLDVEAIGALVDRLEAAGWLRGEVENAERIRNSCARGRAAQVATQMQSDPAGAEARASEWLNLYPDSTLLQEAAIQAAVLATPGDADAAERAALRYEQQQRNGLYLGPQHQLGAAVADALLAASRRAAADGNLFLAVARAQRATELSLGNRDAFAQLARHLQSGGRLPEAIAAAERAARGNPEHQPLLDALRRAADPSVVTVPIDPRTRSARATVLIGAESVSAVIDTGASTTTVPVAVAERLGLITPDSPRVQVTTASGIEIGRAVRLPSLRLGTLELRNVEAIAMDLPGELASGMLLGMTALGQWSVEVDGAAGQVVIRNRQ